MQAARPLPRTPAAPVPTPVRLPRRKDKDAGEEARKLALQLNTHSSTSFFRTLRSSVSSLGAAMTTAIDPEALKSTPVG